MFQGITRDVGIYRAVVPEIKNRHCQKIFQEKFFYFAIGENPPSNEINISYLMIKMLKVFLRHF